MLVAITVLIYIKQILTDRHGRPTIKTDKNIRRRTDCQPCHAFTLLRYTEYHLQQRSMIKRKSSTYIYKQTQH